MCSSDLAEQLQAGRFAQQAEELAIGLQQLGTGQRAGGGHGQVFANCTILTLGLPGAAYASIVIKTSDPTMLPASALLAAAAGGAPLLLRQLFDAATGTFTHLLADVATAEGVLIDPVFEQHERDLALIQELGIRLVACLDRIGRAHV